MRSSSRPILRSPGIYFATRQRVLLADRANVRNPRCARVLPSPRVAAIVRRALVEHRRRARCDRNTGFEGAREATEVLLNHSAADLVKIRGREFAMRPEAPGIVPAPRLARESS